MNAHWQKLISDAEHRTEFFLATQLTDAASGAVGSTPTPWGIPDPKPTMFQAATALACYLNPDSKLARDPRIPPAYRQALEFAFSQFNPDGTFDYPYCNFRSAPDTAFIINRIFITRGLLARAEPDPALDGLRARIDVLLEKACRGIMAGGFHTPNHRWACAAALASWHRVSGHAEFRQAAEKYLIEGIDNNADGEYAERSAGNYNVVNDDQMLMLADALDDPSFLDPIERNLTMMFHYIDPDGSVFTGNSTRQDRGTRIWPEQYYFHYLNMAHRRQRPDFAAMARQIMERQITAGQPAPDYLDAVMLHRGSIDYGESAELPPINYRKLFVESGLARGRQGDFSYSLLKNNPVFLHFQSGSLQASLRLGVGFFERRDFVASDLRQEEDSYVLELLARGWYYLPFKDKPPSSDWWAMDNQKRDKLWGPDLKFLVRVKERASGDGIDLRIAVDGWAEVPLRLEIGLSPGAELESDSFVLNTRAGEAILVKSGTLLLRKGLDTLAVGPAFAQHRNMDGTYGSQARSPDLFSAYFTALSPMERTISLYRPDPRRSTP